MKKLTFMFKGERNYVQGGDVYNAIDEVIGNDFIKKLVFKKFTHNHCMLVDQRPLEPHDIIAQCTIQDSPHHDKKAWVVESSEQVQDRYDFDEGIITNSASILKNSITLNVSTPYSTIEKMIALTKCLSYHLSPDINGKWVFGQLDLTQRLPQNFDNIVISRRTKPSTKFNTNEIIIDGKAYGTISFIAGTP
jgi:hypothetical protein